MAVLNKRAMIVSLCCLVCFAPGASAQLVSASPTGNATGGIAVSGTGNAQGTCVNLLYVCAPGAAVSGLGSASGDSAVAGSGQSQGAFVAVTGVGSASSNGVSIAPAGDANGKVMALSVAGGADCHGQPNCVAVSLTGHANQSALSGCDIMTSQGQQQLCGIGAYDTAFWTAWNLLF